MRQYIKISYNVALQWGFQSLVLVRKYSSSRLEYFLKVKVKEGHTTKERRRGAHLPFIGR